VRPENGATGMDASGRYLRLKNWENENFFIVNAGWKIVAMRQGLNCGFRLTDCLEQVLCPFNDCAPKLGFFSMPKGSDGNTFS
jgi:hypothetical protein